MLLELLSSRQVTCADVGAIAGSLPFFRFSLVPSHSADGRQNDPLFRRIPCAERQAQRELGRGFPSCVTPTLASAGRDHVADRVSLLQNLTKKLSTARTLRSDGRS